jgi:hypothetical protein
MLYHLLLKYPLVFVQFFNQTIVVINSCNLMTDKGLIFGTMLSKEAKVVMPSFDRLDDAVVPIPNTSRTHDGNGAINTAIPHLERTRLVPESKDVEDPAVGVEEPMPMNVNEWKSRHVSQWLRDKELGQYSAGFEENSVSGPLLLSLQEIDLEEELKVESVLHRRKLMQEIQTLRDQMELKKRQQEEEIQRSRAAADKRRKISEGGVKSSSKINYGATKDKADVTSHSITLKSPHSPLSKRQIDFTKMAGLSQVRLAQSMKREKAKNKTPRKTVKVNSKSNLWKFSYDGEVPASDIEDGTIGNAKTSSLSRASRDKPSLEHMMCVFMSLSI